MTRRHSLAFAALSAQRIAGANSRPRIGMIGVGNIGRRHADLMLVPLQREGALEVAAIFVCALTIPQAKSLTEFAESSKRIVQVGSQYASEDRAHEAREVIAQYKVSGRPWHNNQYYNGEFMRMLREPSRNPHDRPNPKAS